MKINNIKFNIAIANVAMEQKDLAEKTGLTPETISRIKNGQQEPRLSTVGKIAKALEVNVEDLID